MEPEKNNTISSFRATARNLLRSPRFPFLVFCSLLLAPCSMLSAQSPIPARGFSILGGPVAHDSAAVSFYPLLEGCYASAAAPSDVSADSDAVRAWCLRNGARAVVLTAGGALIGGDATNGLDVDVTRLPALVAGSALIGKVGIDQTTPGTTNRVDLGAAIPAGTNLMGKVGIDQTTPGTTNRVDIGAALPAGTNAIGKLAANSGVDIGDVDVLSVPADPFGANADVAATAGSTGSIQAKLRLMTSQLDAIQTAIQLIDDDQTGATPRYYTSVGTTEDEHEIKATAGRLFSISVTNTNAAARYLRCYNLTQANTTPGTSTVFIGLAIPGATTGAGFTTNFGPSGIAFGTALTCALTTGAADTDVAEVAANEIKVIYVYK